MSIDPEAGAVPNQFEATSTLTRSQDVIPTTQLAHRVAYLGAE